MEQRVPGKALAEAKEEYPPQEFVIVEPEEVQDAQDQDGVHLEGA